MHQPLRKSWLRFNDAAKVVTKNNRESICTICAVKTGSAGYFSTGHRESAFLDSTRRAHFCAGRAARAMARAMIRKYTLRFMSAP